MPIGDFGRFSQFAREFRQDIDAVLPKHFQKKENARIYPVRVTPRNPDHQPDVKATEKLKQKNVAVGAKSKPQTDLVNFVKALFPTKVGIKQAAGRVLNPLLNGKLTDKVAHFFSKDTEAKQGLAVRNFQDKVCEPLERSRQVPEDLKKLGQKTLQALVSAQNEGILDRSLCKRLLMKAESAGIRASALCLEDEHPQFSIVKEVHSHLANVDSENREIIEAFLRPDLILSTLDTLANVKDPKELQAALKELCPSDLLKRADLPKTAGYNESWHQGVNNLKTILKEAYKESLAKTFEDEVCTPLETADPSDPNLQQAIDDIGNRAADVLIDAEKHGMLDLSFYKDIVNNAVKAGCSAAINRGGDSLPVQQMIVESLKSKGSAGQNVLAKFERYNRQESCITSLDNLQINIEEFAKNKTTAKMKEQFNWLSKNCPADALARANLPKTPDLATWESVLENVQSELLTSYKEVLDDIAKIQDPDEKKDALRTFATMSAFGGRQVGEIGDSLRGACSTREKGLQRYNDLAAIQSEASQEVRDIMVDLMLSDSQKIVDNEIIMKTSGQKIDDAAVGWKLLIEGTLYEVKGKEVLPNGAVKLLLSSKEGKTLHLEKETDFQVARATVAPYSRELLLSDQLKVMNKLANQLSELEKVSGSSSEHLEALKLHAEKQIAKVQSDIEKRKAEFKAHVKASDVDAIIDHVFTNFPDFHVSRECTAVINGKSLTLLLIAGPPNDILIKENFLGKGTSGEVYQATSLQTGEKQVVKYATEFSKELDDTDNEIAVLAHLNADGPHQGVQARMFKVSLETENGTPLKAIVGKMYANRDMRSQVEIRRFAMQVLEIKEEEFDTCLTNSDKLGKKMDGYMSRFQAKLDEATTPEAKIEIVRKFREDAGVFIAVLFGDDVFRELSDLCANLEKHIGEESAK